MPTLASLGVPGVGPDRRGELDLYVKCRDGSGNANINAYAVQFCVSPADDMTAPIINKFVPESPGYVAFGINELPLQLFTNEPADCRWDPTDMDYFSMSSNMTCLNQIEDWTIDGWPCSTILDVPEEDDEEIDYYFRCLDQPWLSWDNETENDGDRIANAEGRNYQVVRTTEALVIEVINPMDGETFYSGGVPFIVDVEIHTSGGVDGTADCEYSFGNNGYYYYFSPPGVSVHNQVFNALPAGEHSLQFRCTDEAGNIATASTSFTTEVDSTGPVTTRVYNSGGTLTVITNEPAECAYDHNSCTFDFEDENMFFGSGLVHTLSFETGLEYYIKCKDIYETMGACLVVTGGY